ncbi:MAG TPA: amino acid adenylation domain-containing protein [Actinophytocola sp.]|uniref:non-ribosomal peptide synthetase n=1 Tax=Actinophytocola sp. TaxID=1872138 RepID=UPI002DB7DA7B|nr:amino acid adenylation domain-containing protein [Actinophytocola sp.]HEU5473425.1 amino acid adenylation domain-containing protein [Actinophytocola sp.]
MSSIAAWAPLVAEVLGLPPERVPDAVRTGSFVGLGGTSLQAIALVSQGQHRLGLDLDIARVLATGPLGEALEAATDYVETAPLPTDPARGPVRRELLPGQKAMLAAHVLGQDQPYRLMFTLEPPAPLDPDRTRDALRALAARHESLRTMFVRDSSGPGRIVLPVPHRPRLLHQALPEGADAVRTVHELYGRGAGDLLRPFEAPPVAFVLTQAGERSLLTLLAHHTVVDGWSIGVLCRDFVELYQNGGGAAAGPSPEWIASRLAAADPAGALDRVAARLAGAPRTVALPTDLPPVTEADGHGARLVFALSGAATAAATALARRSRTTVTTVLMSAWALAVARRAGLDDLVLGVPAAGRFEAGMAGIVGLCTRVVPVRCRAGDQLSGLGFLRGTAGALADAVADADLPFERVVGGLGVATDPGHNPLAQIGFAAHHELVPDAFAAGEQTWRIHEGYCHGAVFDVLLYLQAWSDRPRLALEYATSVLTAADAGELAESVQAVLIELAADPEAELARVTGLSPGQLRRLRALGDGAEFDTTGDIWSAFERHARESPDATAITDVATGTTLRYRELHERALAQAALLHECGVRPGDLVALELARSAAEAVAVLGILRLGAGYVAVDQAATAEWRAHLVAAAAPVARIGDHPGIDPVWTDTVDCPAAGAGDVAALPPFAARPAGTAYVAFTSGSTGAPKGVVVPHRAVLRLAADHRMIADPAGSAMLRLAPLAFDASTLELLVPLVNGHAVTVYPPGEATPHDLTEFLRTNPVSHAWLTSGFFHLVADHRPDAFRGLRQLFTGGGVVSPAHVRRVLEHCPGLRITNGYGPTENTTFTATFDVDAPHEVPDPLPIGTPVRGTRLYVVDPAGRAVAPGAIGELRTAGWGLADGYLGEPERTAESFVRGPGARRYRTGDLVRWGADGFLRFLGRNDRQVKIAGHRVELVDVERRIRELPGVLDVVVFLAGDGPTNARLCAAVKGDAPVPVLRQAVEPGLAPYARPQRWFSVEEFPLDRNGKVDLRTLAARSHTPQATEPGPARAAVMSVSLADLEELVAAAWIVALGTDDFDLDEAFFDIGGDSLSLAVARKLIQQRLGRQLPLTDLYRFPTVQALAAHLHAHISGVAA